MQNNDLLSKITSNKTALYLTLAAVIVLFPNVFYVAYHVGSDMPIPYLREIQAFLIGLYISWSIVYFTMKGKVRIAYSFAIFEMLVSFFYYWNRLLFDSVGNFSMNWWIIPAIMIAVFLPWSVKATASTVDVKPSIPVRMKGEKKKKFKKRLAAYQAAIVAVPAPAPATIVDYSASNPYNTNGLGIDSLIMDDSIIPLSNEEKESIKRAFDKNTELPEESELSIPDLIRMNHEKSERIMHLEELLNGNPLQIVDESVNDLTQSWNDQIKVFQDNESRLTREKAWLKDIVLKNATKLTPEEAIKLNEINTTENDTH